MKIVNTFLACLSPFLFISINASAQTKSTETVKIKTSAVCGMCKTTLEKAMAYEKGVKSSELDVKSQTLTVTYRSDKTNYETILKAVNATGYDADQLPAEPRAYERLNDCCKKDNGVH